MSKASKKRNKAWGVYSEPTFLHKLTILTIKIKKIMKKLLIILLGVFTLMSCSPEDSINNPDNTDNPIETASGIIGTWQHFKDEIHTQTGVETIVVQCGETKEISARFQDDFFDVKTANCIGGGITFDVWEQMPPPSEELFFIRYDSSKVITLDGDVFNMQYYIEDNDVVVAYYKRN